MKKGMKPSELLQEVIADPNDPLDIKREFSSGPGGAKTFADGKNKERKFGIELTNATADKRVVIFGKPERSIYGTAAKALTALGVSGEGVFIANGELYTDGAGKKLTARSTNQGRNVDELINFVANSATQVNSIGLSSATADGANPESVNLTEDLRMTWTSPFENPKDRYHALSEYQNNQINSPQFAKVDCRKDFQVIWSNEHFFMVTVNPNTKLTLNFGFGLHDSRPQRFYRAVSLADETVNKMEQYGVRVK